MKVTNWYNQFKMQEDIKFKKLEYHKPDGMNLGKSQVQKEIYYSQERKKENIGMVQTCHQQQKRP
jgi:hypothetical protein